MIEVAHAKINLSLDIQRKRSDGYHELKSVFLPLLLHDTLQIDFSDQSTLTCDDPSMPVDESNLILKAIRLVQSTYGVTQNFNVHVTKRIPAMAGLGGGSSDAAAMLRAMNTMLSMNLSNQDLICLAKQLGADVPFFLKQKPAVVSGIGDVIEEISFPFALPVLLIKPEFGISTKQAYETLRLDLCEHPNMDCLIQSIRNSDYDAMVKRLGNSLEYSAFLLEPDILVLKETIQKMGFDAVLMSGSGSAIFALTRQRQLMDAAVDTLKKSNVKVWETAIYIPGTVHNSYKI